MKIVQASTSNLIFEGSIIGTHALILLISFFLGVIFLAEKGKRRRRKIREKSLMDYDLIIQPMKYWQLLANDKTLAISLLWISLCQVINL